MAEVNRWSHLLLDGSKAERRLQGLPKPPVLYESEYFMLIKELVFKFPLARNSLSSLVQCQELLFKLEVFVQGVGRYFLSQP